MIWDGSYTVAQDVLLTWVLHLLVWATTSGLHAALNQVLAHDDGREGLWWDTRCILYSLPAWELWKKSTKIIQEENLCTGKHTDKTVKSLKCFLDTFGLFLLSYFILNFIFGYIFIINIFLCLLRASKTVIISFYFCTDIAAVYPFHFLLPILSL